MNRWIGSRENVGVAAERANAGGCVERGQRREGKSEREGLALNGREPGKAKRTRRGGGTQEGEQYAMSESAGREKGGFIAGPGSDGGGWTTRRIWRRWWWW
jgi:hypothetical protein